MAVIAQQMLDLFRDCHNCFLLSLVKIYLNEHYSLLQFFSHIEKSFLKIIKFITQSYLFVAIAFIFILKRIFCLPQKPQ